MKQKPMPRSEVPIRIQETCLNINRWLMRKRSQSASHWERNAKDERSAYIGFMNSASRVLGIKQRMPGATVAKIMPEVMEMKTKNHNESGEEQKDQNNKK